MQGSLSRCLFVASLLVACAVGLAAPPLGVFHYQGVLTDADGNPVTGTPDITFWLYGQAENGTSLWKESHGKVAVETGHFSVDLGSLVGFDQGFDFSQDLYLEVEVEGELLDPRVKLRSVPKSLHAVRAGNVDAVDGAPIGADTPSSGRFTTLATTGNVTLGNSSSDSVVITGTLRIASGTPGAGKTLVSDANGNASWETITTPGLPSRVLQVGEGAQYATIQAALEAITDNDASHRYEIRIAPGTYEGPVNLKRYVSLVGAGSANTVIRLPAGSDETTVLTADYDYDASTDNVGNTVRDLSLHHEGATSTHSYALYCEYAPGFTLRNVRMELSSSGTSGTGMRIRNSECILDNVSARVATSERAYGLVLEWSRAVADRLDVETCPVEGIRGQRDMQQNRGVALVSSSLWLRNSSIDVSGAADGCGILCLGDDYASDENEVIVHATRISAPNGQAWRQTDTIWGTHTSCAFHCLLEGAIDVTTGDFQLFGCTDGQGNTLRTGNVPTPGTAQQEDNLVNVLTVGAGGEYATIGEALDAITDNDEDHPYVVKVGPGVYPERVAMKPYVDLVGAGVDVTKVVDDATSSTSRILVAASNSTVRDITFSQDRQAHSDSAVDVSEVANCVFQDVSVLVTSTVAVSGVKVDAAHLVCRNVSVRITGASRSWAVMLSASSADASLTMSDCSLIGYYALHSGAAACTSKLTDCVLTGYVWNDHGSMTIANSAINGSFRNNYESHAVLVGCDVEGSVYNGANEGEEGEAQLEFRNGTIDGVIRGYNASTCLVSFSKLVLSSAPTPYDTSTIKFFHCHDEDLDAVASPSR